MIELNLESWLTMSLLIILLELVMYSLEMAIFVPMKNKVRSCWAAKRSELRVHERANLMELGMSVDPSAEWFKKQMFVMGRLLCSTPIWMFLTPCNLTTWITSAQVILHLKVTGCCGCPLILVSVCGLLLNDMLQN